METLMPWGYVSSIPVAKNKDQSFHLFPNFLSSKRMKNDTDEIWSIIPELFRFGIDFAVLPVFSVKQNNKETLVN